MFFSSDFHFGDDRFEIMQRPFKTLKQASEAIVEGFNEIVPPDGQVFMLGDVFYEKCNPEDYFKYLEAMNGTKLLIRGNHDRKFSDDMFLKFFDVIVPEGDGINLEIDGRNFYCTHYPTRGKVDRFNLVGHIHSAWKVQLNSINVGVDVNHFRPFTSERISFLFNAIEKYYDNDVWVAYDEINSTHKNDRGKKSSYLK